MGQNGDEMSFIEIPFVQLNVSTHGESFWRSGVSADLEHRIVRIVFPNGERSLFPFESVVELGEPGPSVHACSECGATLQNAAGLASHIANVHRGKQRRT